jgi:hypothetical protein
MASLCYHRHRFPPEIIQHAIWVHLGHPIGLISGGTESLQTRRWRRQSRANPSLYSLINGKIQRNLSI